MGDRTFQKLLGSMFEYLPRCDFELFGAFGSFEALWVFIFESAELFGLCFWGHLVAPAVATGALAVQKALLPAIAALLPAWFPGHVSDATPLRRNVDVSDEGQKNRRWAVLRRRSDAPKTSSGRRLAPVIRAFGRLFRDGRRNGPRNGGNVAAKRGGCHRNVFGHLPDLSFETLSVSLRRPHGFGWWFYATDVGPLPPSRIWRLLNPACPKRWSTAPLQVGDAPFRGCDGPDATARIPGYKLDRAQHSDFAFFHMSPRGLPTRRRRGRASRRRSRAR
ncbi:hypothetical protein M885DRAFT_290925 [Pelagophyceae sp. CCMP2097]|nr:hypothetical protein M885DRAFT_290925 [Pelagophyceae sp. CCMP2097]